jgi:acetylornithine deacetylase/succinyl-diaminopimelate desuccinylase family protein
MEGTLQGQYRIELRQKIEQALDILEVIDLASGMISIESHRDAPGRERPCAEYVAWRFSDWGLEPKLEVVLEDRPNVYCTLPGSGGGRSLMLNGHIDTVPAYQMDIPPFNPYIQDGYLYGRGTVDMKGPIACMMVAMRLLHQLEVPLRGDLIFTGVINEEDRSEGTEFLVRNGPTADRCVVGEPTSLEIMPGHRGLEWLEFSFQGKAAHGGTPEKGINAISKAARFIRRVEESLAPRLAQRVHPLIGPAVMNFGVIRGGTQPSSVADHCLVQLDRRWIPQEKLDQVLGEYQEILDELAAEDPTFQATMTRMESNMATMDHMPLELSLDDDLVTTLQRVLEQVTAKPPVISAFGGWTDASLISNFGKIPTLVFGPGDLSVAHSRCEMVSIEELRLATIAYALLAAEICG